MKAIKAMLVQLGNRSTVQLMAHNIENIVTSGTATTTYQLTNAGVVNKTEGATTTALENWILTGAGADYDVRATLTGDALDTSSGTSVWLNLGTSRSWGYSFGGNAVKSCTLLVEIALTGTTTPIASASITMYCEKSLP